MKVKSVKPQAFVEQEPLIVEVKRTPKVTHLDINGNPLPKPARALRPVPDAGEGVVRVQPIGGRLTLRPSDRVAAEALGAARATLGFHWDAKKGQGLGPQDRLRGYVYHFDNFLRRGVTEWDSLRLLAIMTGLPLEMAPGVERNIARYRSRLERQLRPIPRVTWFDEEAAAQDSELEAEIALGNEAAALRRWGPSGAWWAKKKS